MVSLLVFKLGLFVIFVLGLLVTYIFTILYTAVLQAWLDKLCFVVDDVASMTTAV